MNSLNVQKCDPEASKKKALIQSFKKKVPLKVSSWCYTQTLSRKVRGSKSGHLRPFVEHSCVKLFEKIHIVLNALFVALWLVQAQLQVLQTHFKLFLSLQVKMQFPRFNTVTTACTRSIRCERSKLTLPCVCSDEAASFHYPAGFSPLQAPRF